MTEVVVTSVCRGIAASAAGSVLTAVGGLRP
jgi:hypothetical protein